MTYVFTANPLVILLGGIISMVYGMIWYSPLLFAKPWMKELGLTEKKLQAKQTNMGLIYGTTFIGALVQALIFEQIFMGLMPGMRSMHTGLCLGLLVWLGFTAIPQLTLVLFEHRSIKLYAINVGYYLAILLSLGALAGWLQ